MELTAKFSPFTTFCEGPANIEKGYPLFLLFHRRNHAPRLPADKGAQILVVSSGVGYFQHFLRETGYTSVKGVDSDPAKVAYARDKGFDSECGNCFAYLASHPESFDLIFAEQELNHLTRNEVLLFLNDCHAALKPGGRLIVCAANAANPIIAPEYLGNNIDHYTSFTENNLRQYFSASPFQEGEVFPHDFYVIWQNPLNYPAKAITALIHIALRIVFQLYGKSNKIFTKRIGGQVTKR